MWETEQAISFEVTSWHGTGDFDVIDNNGNILEYQITDCQDGYALGEGADHVSADILVLAKVPAFGFTTLKIAEKGKSNKPASERGFIDLLPANYPEECEDEVCFDNGRLKATFVKGSLSSLQDQKTGKSIECPVPGLKFFEYPPAQAWLTNHEKLKTHDFDPQSWTILENGPIRFTYEVYGKVAWQETYIIYHMDKNSAGLDIEVKPDFFESFEGMLVFSAKADADSEIYAGIPFGFEKREFFDNLPTDMEWALKGQIYGRNWCSFAAQQAPVALVTQNCSVYYIFEPKEGEMQLVLNRHMPLYDRTDRWVGKMPEATSGNGKNDYSFSLIFCEEAGKSADIFKYHRNKAFPVSANLKFDAGNTGAANGSLFALDKDNIINTAAYNAGGRTILRFFECEGQKTNCKIRLPEGTKSVKATDFEGNELPEVKLSFDLASIEADVEFLPHKIITLELESEGD
jgi:hypothetical protein